jgi:hypothetical protein
MRTMTRSLSESSRAIRHRHLATTRKRDERERKRSAGRPDTATIDRAIVDTLRSFVLRERPEPVMQRVIRVEDLITTVALHLLKRSWEVHASGAEPVVFTREGVAAALDARLLQPQKRPGKPAPKAAAEA